MRAFAQRALADSLSTCNEKPLKTMVAAAAVRVAPWRGPFDRAVKRRDESAVVGVDDVYDIEVVIDRIKVRDDVKTRLAESFETALALSGGVAKVALMDEPDAAELVF